MFDVKYRYFKLQVLKGAVGADIRESSGELFGRGVGRERFYWIGSGQAKSSS